MLVDPLTEVKSDQLGDTLANVQAGVPVEKLAATLEVVVADKIINTLSEVEARIIIDILARREEGRDT